MGNDTSDRAKMLKEINEMIARHECISDPKMLELLVEELANTPIDKQTE